MRLLVKIILISLLFLLVVFSILTDLSIGQELNQNLDLGIYLKLVSLLGLVIAVFLVWGYRRRVEVSQKYRRADEVLAQAETALERKRQSCDRMEQRLQETFAEKEKGLADQIEVVRRECQERLNALKAQNVELKETVAKLMRALKNEKKKRP